MKTVAVITFHRHNNYGAVLQCYALQQILKKLGYEPSVIDYRCKIDEHPLSIEAIKSRGFIRCVISALGKISRIPRFYKFYKFRKKLDLTEKFNKQRLHNISESFDCYIAGSDNIWNAQITGLDSAYFLDFVYEKRKRNTYAASFGSDTICEKFKEKYYKYLSGINTFLMREDTGLEIVAGICGLSGKRVLDPTLLIDRNEWDCILNLGSIKDRYVFAYQLVPSSFFLKKAVKIANQLKCKLIVVPFAQGRFMKCCNKPGIGPEEWMAAIKNAEYVITDSFHGCVFSILFHKKFNAVISQLGTRIYSLLDMLGLENRVIVKDKGCIDMSDIDYKNVDKILEKEREDSLYYLQKMIDDV